MPTIKRHLCKAGFHLLLMVCGLTSPAHAGSFNINPVRIQLSDKAATEVVHVTNSGNADVTVQLQTLQWSQQDGEDKLTITRDLIATPQIFRLKAGTTQIIRIGLVKKPDLSREFTYRLILEEIPPPPEPGFQGLKLALRISLPVFVKPAGALTQDWDIHLPAQGNQAPDMINLTVNNRGLTHIQLHSLKIHAADEKGEVLGAIEKGFYLLAGQTKHLPIKIKNELPLPSALLIRAETSTGKVEFHAKPGAP